jgi:hypothetical protein
MEFYVWSVDTGIKMGYGFRFFIVDDDDSLHLIPMARFNRLLDWDPDECLPEFAGQKKRCALVVLEVKGRTPLEIYHIDYIMLSFDAQGRIDKPEYERVSHLAIRSFSPDLGDEQPGNIIDAGRQFNRRRYENEVRWNPTPAIEYAIDNAIFGDHYF